MSLEQKSLLRVQTLRRLRSLSAGYVQAASAQLRAQLLPLLGSARHICLYAPLPHEVNLLPLLTEAPGRAYYFPRCLSGHRLSFHRVQQPAAELVPGAMGIPAPLPHLPSIEPAQVELVLVPGVAFTRAGERLGYGGGYYDRFLPQLSPAARTIALALPEQLVDTLPTDEHDTRVHSILCAELL